MSWTGSENERRPQGICLPPSAPMNSQSRFTIPIGTQVECCSVFGEQVYRPHTTQIELGFDKYDTLRSGYYTFRHDAWFIRVRRSLVDKRK